MSYCAILENDCKWLMRGKFFARFDNEGEYRRTLSMRPYLKEVKAPATEEDFLEMVGAKSLDECPEMHF